MDLKVAIADRFLEGFANLPKKTQKKTTEFLSAFKANPKSPGINYERIQHSKDDHYRSVRIDQQYRGIVRAPDNGSVYLMLWVGKHDDAYKWARTNECRVNTITGALQIFESIVEPKEIQPAIPAVTELPDSETPSCQKLFDISSYDLLNLGLPEELLDRVINLRDENELESLEYKLPKDIYETLYLLAAGESLQSLLDDARPPTTEAISTSIDQALENAKTQQSFWVAENEIELQKILEQPLAKWRVFLHPSQRKIVNRKWNGPVRVLGGAGTGKTVVAMHRAKWLARHLKNEHGKVLFTTFSENLAKDIDYALENLCSREEKNKIEVKHIDAWVNEYLTGKGCQSKIVSNDDYEMLGLWSKALVKKSIAELPDSFYIEEWERIISPNRVKNSSEYMKVKRLGRGVKLNRQQRLDIWPVFEELISQMQLRSLITFDEAMFLALDFIKQETLFHYKHIIVDEAQDMGPQALSLLRGLVAETSNDMFLVGDGHQRIYRRHAIMKACGINIMGRGKKLILNYRTTEQTRRFATAVLEGIDIDDLDGNKDSMRYKSLIKGEMPVLYGFNNFEEEADYIIGIVQELIDSGQQPSDICITARTTQIIEKYRRILRSSSIETVQITGDNADIQNIEGVRLATFHRVKGLEFRFVIMASVNSDQVPYKKSDVITEDPTEARQLDINERALFHVAASRAIKKLYVSWFGQPSIFIKNK